MATTVLGLKTFAASDPVDYNEINDNYNKIDNGVKTAMQGRAAYNLLDNSDFANPVNQRGRSGTYEGVSNYTTFVIDRWKTWSTGCTYTLSSAGLQIANLNASSSNGPWEVLPNPERMKGKTYTLAVWYNGGNVACGNVAVPTGTLTEDKYLSAVSASGTRPGLRFIIASTYSSIDFQIMISAGQTVTVEWAALYEGAYTADTLPSYQPKGYAAELAECQRYYQTIPALTHIPGITNTSVSFGAKYKIPTMRIAPTVSIASGQEVSIYTGEYSASTTNYTMQCATMPNQMILNLSLGAGSFVAYKPGMLTFPVEIALSADL